MKRLKIIALILILLVSCAVYAQYLWAESSRPGLLKIYFLDVGQGDAIFIETPSGNQVLIDGGPVGYFGNSGAAILSQLNEVMAFDDKDIDVIIATHPHADHIQGLIKVMEKYNVGAVFDGGTEYDSKTYQDWHALAEKSKVYKHVQNGDSVDLGDDVNLEFLYPDLNSSHKIKNKAHDKMVVGLLRYRDFKLLLTGDLEGYDESKIFQSGRNIQAQFLKVAHHGSRNSTTSDFLNKLSPHFAFISVASKNRYGHPHQQALDRLSAYGVEYFRTDQFGTINLSTDGYFYKIITQKHE